jgi:hypothetical protein
MRGRWLLLLAFMTAAVVCAMRTGQTPNSLHEIRDTHLPSAKLADEFDPKSCGSLTCVVAWQGEAPAAEPIILQRPITQVDGKRELPNPNQPRISEKKALADCAIYLRGIDLSKAKPWDLPAVRVEATLTRLSLFQGEEASPICVVRRGEPVDFVTHESAAHSVQGRGAAFFTQMLAEPDRPVRREMPDEGIVELTSGTGHFWHRGYLVVSEQPYAGVTDADGRLRLEAIPAGNYDVIFWKANWHIASMERDPELIRHVRMQFGPPVKKQIQVSIRAGESAELRATFSASDFSSR